jgi:hypothetical protein
MMRKCPECDGQGKVDVGGWANFGRGLEPIEQLEDCMFCNGEGKISADEEEE